MGTNKLDSTPRVWIGCLHCYNAGCLVGEWFDAVDADEATLADVHRDAGGICAGCEELWYFDHENLPVRGEMGPNEAAEWGRSLPSVPEHQREALCAWVRSGDYVAEGTGDRPSIPDFEDRYRGEWESLRACAKELAHGTGLLSGVTDEVAWYFDWVAWTRDLAFDYTAEDAPGGGVFVFRTCDRKEGR